MKQIGYVSLILAAITIVVPTFTDKKSDAKVDANINTNYGTANIADKIYQNTYYQGASNPNIENERPDSLKNLRDAELIKTWFQLSRNQSTWRDACSLLEQRDCNVKDGKSINDVHHFIGVTTINGFEDPEIFHPENAPENLWCVKYHYNLKSSTIPGKIIEVMQYWLGTREDGEQQIETKLCEKKWIEGIGERTCPDNSQASIDYCI